MDQLLGLALDVVAHQNSDDFLAQIAGQLHGLTDQLLGDLLNDAVALFNDNKKYPYSLFNKPPLR